MHTSAGRNSMSCWPLQSSSSEYVPTACPSVTVTSSTHEYDENTPGTSSDGVHGVGLQVVDLTASVNTGLVAHFSSWYNCSSKYCEDDRATKRDKERMKRVIVFIVCGNKKIKTHRIFILAMALTTPADVVHTEK